MALSPECHENKLVLAIPVTGNWLCTHLDQCNTVALFDVDMAKKALLSSRQFRPPPHCRLAALSGWLYEQGVDVVITVGIGEQARGFLVENGIEVLVGAPASPLQDIVQDYLRGELQLDQ